MSENDETPTETPEPAEAPEAEAPAKRTLRDRFAGTGERLRGTRGLVAATLAALIVGGLGGAAIHAAVDDDRHDGDRGHREFFRGERPGPPRDFRHGPGDVPGELPPTTTPEDEEASPTPSPSGSSSS